MLLSRVSLEMMASLKVKKNALKKVKGSTVTIATFSSFIQLEHTFPDAPRCFLPMFLL